MRFLIAGLVSIISLQFSFSQKTGLPGHAYINESVDYSLKYGIFKIGEAHVEFNIGEKYSGAFIQAVAMSTGLVKFIKDIHYSYECLLDTSTGLPDQDSRILIEGDYVDTSTVYYDRISRSDSTIIFSKKTDTIVGPKIIYDILSGFYLYRLNHLSAGLPLNHTFNTTTFFIDKIWNLSIIYCGKETISTRYGPIECLKVKPVTVIGHFFRRSDAMTIWFSNNGEYIPVKFSLDFKLGTIYGIVTDYKRPVKTKP